MSGNIGYDIADVIHSLYDNIPIASIVVEMKKKNKRKRTNKWLHLNDQIKHENVYTLVRIT